MKQLFEYIVNTQFNNTIIKEEASLITNENIINESFKSNILSKLAKTIYDVEKENNQTKINRAKKLDQEYPYYNGSKHDPKLVNFRSIFGPKIEYGRHATVIKKGIQGLKWSEITDADFKEYTNPVDKELIKLIKSTYQKEDKHADFIITKNDKVINFIKAYGKSKNDDGVYYFKYKEGWKGVTELKEDYYTYKTRSLKTKEVIELLQNLENVNDIKVYALEITNDMIKDYSNLLTNREISQKGVINYDKESLEDLLRKQKSRYKTLINEIRAKKLQKDPNVLFEEIKNANTEILDLYKTIMGSSENLDQNFDLGHLLNYVSYAYECLYKSLKYTHQANKQTQKALKNGLSPIEADEWGRWDRASSKEEIRNAKDYLEEVKKMIQDIKNNLK